MANIKLILARLLKLVGDSNDYFVLGSLSFLPLLGNYRMPEHDVDVAIARLQVRWLPRPASSTLTDLMAY